ncbi:MAG: AgmX/PglI C-terminal domain-containing protein [Desulfobacteraceae bacterium]|jgi:hypothetical protein
MNKLHGNRAYVEPDPTPAVTGFDPVDTSNDHAITHTIRIEVYKGSEYQGKKTFSQDRIVIGKSLEADLVLSDNEIADKQACITFIDEQPVILDQTQKTGLLIKGGLYGISIIDSSEQIGLGPYVLKINHHKTSTGQISKPHIGYDKDMKMSPGIDLSSDSENRDSDSPEQDLKVVEPVIKNEEPEVDLFALFEGGREEDHELYDLIFEGDIRTGFDIYKVKYNLSKILKSDASRIEQFFNRKKVVLKSGLEIDVAKKLKKIFEKSGAVCRLKARKSTKSIKLPVQEKETEKFSTTIPEQSSGEILNEVKNDALKEKPDDHSEARIQADYTASEDYAIISQTHHFNQEASSEIQPRVPEQAAIPGEEEIVPPVEKPEPGIEAELIRSLPEKEKPAWKFYGVEVDDEDDEDEEDLPADFNLKDKIDDLNASRSRHNALDGKYLEIIKLYGREVMDIQHLREREKYYIRDFEGKRFCLAELKRANEALFSFKKNIEGNLENARKSPVATRLLMKDENCISKRKGIYRTKIPGSGKAVISDGYFTYHMRMVSRSLVPDMPVIKGANKKSYKHFGVSFAFHIVFLLFLGLFPSFDNGNNLDEEARFVKLDSNQLAELEKVVNPQPKPKPPAPAPVVEPKLKKQAEPKLVKKQPVRTASKKKPSKTKKSSRPSRHPDAGGGFGEGNVATRNINEAGILGMISDSVGLQPKNALAAVTNLDAVSSPNVTSSNLKVGGVVGKLGTGEISVPKGAIISTKGSSQVLRSYGRKGEGTVAALEKGKTGEQEVMGMVTATLDKSVRIRGGLSMEAVKRVIDAHLDDITYCYETELMSNPSIVGKVMFEWKILMSGEVGEVRIKSSSVNSHEIHSCIKESIRTWRFPKPSGSEVMVSYPFVFDIVGF